jgi:hypothetical protein
MHGTLQSGTGLANPIGTIVKAVWATAAPHPLLCPRKGLVLKARFGGLPWPVRPSAMAPSARAEWSWKNMVMEE